MFTEHPSAAAGRRLVGLVDDGHTAAPEPLPDRVTVEDLPRQRVVRVLAQTARRQPREDGGERRLVTREAMEVGDREHQRPHGRGGEHGRRSRLLRQERHLAEDLAGAGALQDVMLVSDLDADLDLSLLDDDEAVPGFPLFHEGAPGREPALDHGGFDVGEEGGTELGKGGERTEAGRRGKVSRPFSGIRCVRARDGAIVLRIPLGHHRTV